MRINALSATLGITLFSAFPVCAATYYVAPIGATQTCPPAGTEECPWDSVGSALSSGKIASGDILKLKDGKHGRVQVSGYKFTTPVVIEAVTPQAAQVDQINVANGASGLTFRNLTVYGQDSDPSTLVTSDATSSNVVFDGLDIRSREHIEDRLSWTASQWVQRSRDGILLFSSNSKVVNCTLTAVKFGISSNGPNSEVVGNRVVDFSADALRAMDFNTIRGNFVANSFRVDGNHDDGFQSWAGATGKVDSLTLDGNTILEWTHDPSHPLKSSLEGIGLFDGFYDNLVIRNNVIAVTAHHGIAVYGARNAQIVNNTVVQSGAVIVDYPWIAVFAHKNGTPSSNVMVANNVAMRFSDSSAKDNVVFTDNSVVFHPSAVFESPTAFDFRPKIDSGFIDTANALHAPSLDIVGGVRPFGAGPDRGAYEIGSSSSGGAIDGAAPAPTTTVPSTGTDTTENGTSPTNTTPTETTTDPVTTPISPGPKFVKARPTKKEKARLRVERRAAKRLLRMQLQQQSISGS
ncbi:MAG: right-handed parallel beta-helix repeat-containing protein [Pseudomonadota bacterium]